MTEAQPTCPNSLVAKAKALGVELAPDAAESLLRYLDAMLVVNEHVNLTAIRDREAAVVLHVLDSVAFGLLGLHPRNILDIGTGNGFPGIGVAALHPRASVLLMDRTGKKIRAIGTCLLTARIGGIETAQLDAAQAPGLKKEYRRAFDLVTARAVGTPAAMAELAVPMLAPGGHLVLWLDAEIETPERLENLTLEKVVTYQLPEPAARTRRLASYVRRGTR
ncbi:MAG: hypothetical protein RIT25_2493 [Planctomycetota bacterium]|jgi:16S rRNA (guanine527-N7)-methyltransferase